MANSGRDQNDVPTLSAISSVDGVTVVPLVANPTTGRLLIDNANTGALTSINGDATQAQTLTVGTTGTDFAIVDNGSGDHKFNIPTASASNRGLLSTTDYTRLANTSGTNTGDQTVVGTANQITASVAGAQTTISIPATFESSALYLGGTAASWRTTTTPVLGASGTSFQSGILDAWPTVAANDNFTSALIQAKSPVVAATGTHPLLASQILKATSKGTGAATVTNTATSYIEGAGTGGTNNYAQWIDSGEVRIDGDIGDTTNRVNKIWSIDAEFTNTPTVSGVAVPTISSTNTLTNKRITPQVLSATTYTTNTGTSIASDTQDMFIVTAQTGALLFNNPSGTPTDGQKLIISVASSTTTARALTWGNAYGATTVALPTTTAATTATLTMHFIWSASKSLWQIQLVA